MTSNLCLARAGFDAPAIDTTKPLPTDIQWMPPGQHEIFPTVNGEVQQMTINVTAALAARLNPQLQGLRQRAAEGKGDLPFIDFNHDDAESAGEVTELYWGGADPVQGGIRLKVNWSQAGEQAVRGKMYRRFSPAWYFDENGDPTAIDVNMGGLVNRAAFQKIQAVMAKGGQATHPATAADFMQLAEAHHRQTGQSFADCAYAAAKQNPAAETAYKAEMAKVDNHPFRVAAKALMDQRGISQAAAYIEAASAVANIPYVGPILAPIAAAAVIGGLEAMAVFKDGGPVSGPGTGTSDSIVARLSNGEFVMPAHAVDRYGLGTMEAIRSGQFGAAQSGSGNGGSKSLADSKPTVVIVNDRHELLDFLKSPAAANAVIAHINSNKTRLGLQT